MCSRMEEGLLFSELRKEKHPSLSPFPQDSSLLPKGPFAVTRNLILIGFDFYCGPMYCAVTHDWLAYISSINISLLICCRIRVGLLNLFLIFMGREVTFLERERRWDENPLLCMLPCRQDGREILVGSTDWWAVSVIIFHSVMKPGDNARVAKLEWHFALSHWVQQLSCI